MKDPATFKIGRASIRRGETRDVKLQVSQRYTGDPVSLPLRVLRGKSPGPTVCVTATIHGEELNGLGIIHELMFSKNIRLKAGTLILVPVVNVFGFETQDRYMPDRRDLNRCFPGRPDGNLTSRFAHSVFTQIIARCDVGIDLHTAAGQRTNFPNIRGDMSDPKVRELAEAFGCELIVNNKGPEGSLRREAIKAGCATILLEAGEPLKIEPGVLEGGKRGVCNVLKHLGMMTGECIKPTYQVQVKRSTWVRSEAGGLLRFHISPGNIVSAGQPIATNASVFGKSLSTLISPVDGVVLGMTTLPTAKPGEPVCHIAVPSRSLRSIRRSLAKADDRSLHHRLRKQLATNISVAEQETEVPSLANDEAS